MFSRSSNTVTCQLISHASTRLGRVPSQFRNPRWLKRPVLSPPCRTCRIRPFPLRSEIISLDRSSDQVSRVRGTFHTNSQLLWVVGSTFRATHIHTGQVVALKVQPADISYPSNAHERAVYPMLQGGTGMPTLWASGLWGRWDYLAMDLLGSSLDRLYRKSGKNMMDLRSACSFAIQLVSSFLSLQDYA